MVIYGTDDIPITAFKRTREIWGLPAITLLPEEETLTYKELLEKSRCIAEYLLYLGVEKGTMWLLLSQIVLRMYCLM